MPLGRSAKHSHLLQLLYYLLHGLLISSCRKSCRPPGNRGQEPKDIHYKKEMVLQAITVTRQLAAIGHQGIKMHSRNIQLSF